jgi:hypothetical protein
MCNNILISNIKNHAYLIDFNRRSRKARQNKARAVRPDAGKAPAGGRKNLYLSKSLHGLLRHV